MNKYKTLEDFHKQASGNILSSIPWKMKLSLGGAALLTALLVGMPLAVQKLGYAIGGLLPKIYGGKHRLKMLTLQDALSAEYANLAELELLKENLFNSKKSEE